MSDARSNIGKLLHRASPRDNAAVSTADAPVSTDLRDWTPEMVATLIDKHPEPGTLVSPPCTRYFA